MSSNVTKKEEWYQEYGTVYKQTFIIYVFLPTFHLSFQPNNMHKRAKKKIVSNQTMCDLGI
jgi:hypothetical protein